MLPLSSFIRIYWCNKVEKQSRCLKSFLFYLQEGNEDFHLAQFWFGDRNSPDSKKILTAGGYDADIPELKKV